ncbi:type II toxin-antitoxin system Phd/YefM family antitoxin [Rhizobium rhizophilum]|uniref:Type II toxin-antitoxin system Phd/YefM family antitoxin n=1 Tax=Rhizobium rhizophilum TaxID=1850373 RepID=A0ABY2QUL2_9HYPH|nr:type II toxin-antitoxin system Phd/YefM family antitoxin [Rhizobium rhizophilum]
MATISLTSRELNHDVGRAKKAAEAGPVVITDRGRPSHVLMTYGEFERNRCSAPTLPAVA